MSETERRKVIWKPQPRQLAFMARTEDEAERGRSRCGVSPLPWRTAVATGWPAENRGTDMADITRLGEISLPKLSEDMNPEDARAINNYLMQLRDQMLYMMQNLDETNFSDTMRDKLTAMGLKVE